MIYRWQISLVIFTLLYSLYPPRKYIKKKVGLRSKDVVVAFGTGRCVLTGQVCESDNAACGNGSGSIRAAMQCL